jgi:hypothetical protein
MHKPQTSFGYCSRGFRFDEIRKPDPRKELFGLDNFVEEESPKQSFSTPAPQDLPKKCRGGRRARCKKEAFSGRGLPHKRARLGLGDPDTKVSCTGFLETLISQFTPGGHWNFTDTNLLSFLSINSTQLLRSLSTYLNCPLYVFNALNKLLDITVSILCLEFGFLVEFGGCGKVVQQPNNNSSIWLECVTPLAISWVQQSLKDPDYERFVRWLEGLNKNGGWLITSFCKETLEESLYSCKGACCQIFYPERNNVLREIATLL